MNSPEGVLAIVIQGLEVMLLVAAPALGAALVIGLVVSILQAATQVNEMTLAFIPKLIGVVAALALAGPWMIAILTDYVRRLFGSIPGLIG
ncbi:MAG: flagellar biosynthesis protein FliQ [Betaproteobacteria bacterium]